MVFHFEISSWTSYIFLIIITQYDKETFLLASRMYNIDSGHECVAEKGLYITKEFSIQRNFLSQ